MKITKTAYGARITGCEDFAPEKMFHCGQCFRWNDEGVGIVRGHAARVVRAGDTADIFCEPALWDALWRPYFDLDRDYAALRRAFSRDENLKRAAAFGAGIRILRQDAWEALVSFLISQCNRIPRIRAIIERLCEQLGAPLFAFGKERYAFPEPARLAGCTPEDLAPLRAGYRAGYLLAAAQAVASGALDFSELAQLPTDAARARLCALPGVGEKVADCVLLFGMGRHDAFPMDVWMKRAVRTLYGGNVPDFGAQRGVAQQYLFYAARAGEFEL